MAEPSDLTPRPNMQNVNNFFFLDLFINLFIKRF